MPADGRARPGRKQDILEVFTEFVARRGYDNVSIREVADALGLSKGTILHHYASKDRLLEQAHGAYMQRRLAEARVLVDALETPREQLVALTLQNLFAMHRDHAATVAFAREIVRFASDQTMAGVRAMRREYLSMFAAVLERGMEAGEFRREDPMMVALQISGSINWSWTWLRLDGPWSLELLGRSYVRFVVGGVAAAESDELEQITQSVMERVAGVIQAPGAPAPAAA